MDNIDQYKNLHLVSQKHKNDLKPRRQRQMRIHHNRHYYMLLNKSPYNLLLSPNKNHSVMHFLQLDFL